MDTQVPEDNILQSFQASSSLTARQGSGKKLTTLAVGGDLPVLFEPNTLEELSSIVSFANKESIPLRFLGAGSNLLIPDEGLSDWVVKLGRGFRTQELIAEGHYEVGGAMSLMSFARVVSNAGHSGLEFAGGIPASLGGAVRMNAGAHGGEMAEVLTEVQLVLPDGSIEWLPTSEFNFSYRFAEIPTGSIVSAARLQCVQSSAEETAKKLAECLAYRKETQPLTQPSAGSIFKNPQPDKAAGMLIEQAGLRGTCIGGASISQMHANWIVNLERSACYQDVIDLIALCQKTVSEKFGIELEPELVRWGK